MTAALTTTAPAASAASTAPAVCTAPREAPSAPESPRSAVESPRGAVERVMVIIMLLNLAVALAKIVVGNIFGSAAVEADGIHSTFDAAGNVVGLVGLALAARPADERHPYGHGAFEAFASAFIGILLLFAAYEVGWSAVQSLVSGVYTAQAEPLVIGVMVVTICVNICVTTYERRMARKYRSALLGADAKHTLSDVLVSLSVIVGLVFVRCGYGIADSIAALIVTVAILFAAVSVFRDVFATFSDAARLDATEVADCVREVAGVRGCHQVRTRGLEGEVKVDLHILVDPEATIAEAHVIADAVEEHVRAAFPQVAEVLVHEEPDTPEERSEE